MAEALRPELIHERVGLAASLRERLKVFVSSVMSGENLQPERDAAIDGIEALKLTIPWSTLRRMTGGRCS